MPVLEPHMEAFVSNPLTAVLGWTSPSGDPRATPVSYVYEGGDFWITSGGGNKVAALRQDPRVTLTICERTGPIEYAFRAQPPGLLGVRLVQRDQHPRGLLWSNGAQHRPGEFFVDARQVPAARWGCCRASLEVERAVVGRRERELADGYDRARLVEHLDAPEVLGLRRVGGRTTVSAPPGLQPGDGRRCCAAGE